MTGEEFIKFCEDNSLTYEDDREDIFAYLSGEVTLHRELVFAAYRKPENLGRIKSSVETFTDVHFDEEDNVIRLDGAEFDSGSETTVDTVKELENVYKDMVKKYNDFRKQLRIKKIKEL